MADNNGVVNIHGREYKTVALRVDEFREKFSVADGWAILTDMRECSAEQVVFTAEIVSPDGKVVARGFARENWLGQINKTNAVENCETSAIGRALAAAGFAGSEYASANEMESAARRRSGQPSQATATHEDKMDRRLALIIGSTTAEALDKFLAVISRESEEGKISAPAYTRLVQAIEAKRKELAGGDEAGPPPASDGKLFDEPKAEGVGV